MNETLLYEIHVKATPYICYPQAFNHVPFIESVRIVALGTALPRDVEMEIRVQTLHGDVCTPIKSRIIGLTNEHVYMASMFERGGVLEASFDGPALQTLLSLETIEPCTVEVTLFEGSTVVGRGVASLVVAPPRFWGWEYPLTKTAANIAAYVLHYHPEVDALLDVARQILKTQGKKDSFLAYQRDADAVDTQVQAIYEAIVSYGIGYRTSPGSWDADTLLGQDSRNMQAVRTAEMVLQQKNGNCLDLSLLFAAALERVQIHPVVVISHEHAVVGYWRIEKFQPEAVMPLPDVVNFIDSDALRIMEATYVTSRTTYAQSVEQAKKWLYEPGTLSKGTPISVDIAQVRMTHHVVPIPTRVQQANGETVILQAPVIEYRTVTPTVTVTPPVSIASEEGVPPRIVQWKNQLLDLSLANRLIHFKLERSSYIQIPIPGAALHTFEDLLSSQVLELKSYDTDEMYAGMDGYIAERGGGIALPIDIKGMLAHGTVFAHIAPEKYTSVLRKIVRTAKNINDQSGVNQLYIALGSLVWTSEVVEGALKASARLQQAADTVSVTQEKESSRLLPNQIRSPLLLLPITIKPVRAGKGYSITLDQTSPVMPNYSLLEKLRRELDFSLPGLQTLTQDERGFDIQALLHHIRTRIAEANHPFRVDETCVIGFFDFGNYRLWRDLGDNWPKYIKQPLVHHMVFNHNKAYIPQHDPIPGVPGGDVLASELPIAADGSQLDAIQRGLEKQTFVLQGPPGTGKSQTIANLIFAAMRRGMSVLFVTEKSTAAQVVYERLAAIKGDAEQGVETMVLDIHDQDSKPDAIRTQLSRALNAVIAGDDTGFEIIKRRYDTAIQQLQLYPQRLHAVGKFGYSLYTAHERFLALGGSETVAIPASFLLEREKSDFESVIAILKKVQDTAVQSGTAAGNPWVGLSHLTHGEQTDADFYNTLRQHVQSLHASMALVGAQPALKKVLLAAGSLDELRALRMLSAPNADEPDVLRIHGTVTQTNARKRIHALLAAIHDADAALIGSGQRKTDLVETIFAQQTAYKRLRDEVKTYPGLRLAVAWDPQNSLHLAQLTAQLESIEKTVSLQSAGSQTDQQSLQALLAGCTPAEKQLVHRCCVDAEHVCRTLGADETSLRAWQDGKALFEAIELALPLLLRDAVEHDFVMLRRLTAFTVDIGALYEYDLGTFAQQILSGTYRAETIVEIFERSFFAEHTAQLLRTTVLDQFDTNTHNETVTAFAEVSATLRTLISGIASAEMLHRRQAYIEAEIEPITALRRAIQQVRRPMSVRQLLTTHRDVIRAVMPCTIASPNSVAMLLDAPDDEAKPATRYDLVIFDEASQIRVTSAICGIGRADAAVIVGDSKQMPPTSIAEKSLYDEIDEVDDLTAIDEESILNECVLAQIPSRTLTWHYRSENELLIAFSNNAYYDGRLSAFPSPPRTETVSAAVQFVRVDGQYVRTTTDVAALVAARPDVFPKNDSRNRARTKTELLNTNPAEAYAIYQHIVALTKDPATASCSIGVVTFNEKQADYLDMLLTDEQSDATVAERFRGETRDLRTRGFVKSLETIQGDEADIILFSVAFSKNEQGKLPLNFGPLNRIGGERRLNVAITRARQKVIVFCSFDPVELRIEDTTSIGMRDLRDYLEFAMHGPEQVSMAVSRRTMMDRHREQIASRIRAAGYVVNTDVGLTDFKLDIVVSDSGDPQRTVGILLDGLRWKERTTVSDRDIFPIDILQNRMQWPMILRIWLPAWLRNPAAEVQRVADALSSLRLDMRTHAVPIIVPQPHALDGTTQHLTTTENPAIGAPNGTGSAQTWQPWVQRKLGEADVINNLRYMEHMRIVHALMHEIIAAEAPLSQQRMISLVCAAFDVTEPSVEHAREIAAIRLTGIERDAEGFYYPQETGSSTYRAWRVAPKSMSAFRPIDEICLPELVNGLYALCASAPVVALDRLLLGVVQHVNADYLDETILARCLVAIQAAVDSAVIVRTPDARFSLNAQAPFVSAGQ